MRVASGDTHTTLTTTIARAPVPLETARRLPLVLRAGGDRMFGHAPARPPSRSTSAASARGTAAVVAARRIATAPLAQPGRCGLGIRAAAATGSRARIAHAGIACVRTDDEHAAELNSAPAAPALDAHQQDSLLLPSMMPACMLPEPTAVDTVRGAPPLRVIVTGATRGVGRALAREFLWAGDRVFITGRSQESVAATLALLREQTSCDADAVSGMAADCSDALAVAALAAAAPVALGGPVDMWIANAGCSGGFQPLSGAPSETVSEVVSVTLGGALLCAQAAQRLFTAQRSRGTLWLTDGAGGGGDATPMYAAYGASKAGIRQLASSLAAESRQACSPPALAVGLVSPGMCLTELLLGGATARSKALFNALAEQPETAAAELVPALRSAHVSAIARGSARAPHLKVLTLPRALLRMAALPFMRGRFFDAEGRATYAPESERIAALAAARAAALCRNAQPRATSAPHAAALAYATSALVLASAFLTLNAP